MLGISLSSNPLTYGADMTKNPKKGIPDFVASNTRKTLSSNHEKTRQQPLRLNSDSGYVSDIANSAESGSSKSIENPPTRNALYERVRSIKTNLANIASIEVSTPSSGEKYPAIIHSTDAVMKREYHKKFSIPVKARLDKIAALYNTPLKEHCHKRITSIRNHHSEISAIDKKSHSVYDIDHKGSLWKYQVANRIKNSKSTPFFCENEKPARASKWQDPAKSHGQLTEIFSEREMNTTYITHLLTKNIR